MMEKGYLLGFIISFVILTGVVVFLLPVIKWLKPTLIVEVPMLLAVFFLSLVNQIYHYFASLISTFNILPYTRSFIISSVIAVLLSYFLTKYTDLGIWALVISPLIVAFSYNLWKWPLYVLKLYNVSLFTFTKNGLSFSLNILNNIINRIKGI